MKYSILAMKQLAANGDKIIYEAIKKIAKAKGLPMYKFLDIELKKVIENNKEFLK